MAKQTRTNRGILPILLSGIFILPFLITALLSRPTQVVLAQESTFTEEEMATLNAELATWEALYPPEDVTPEEAITFEPDATLEFDQTLMAPEEESTLTPTPRLDQFRTENAEMGGARISPPPSETPTPTVTSTPTPQPGMMAAAARIRFRWTPFLIAFAATLALGAAGLTYLGITRRRMRQLAPDVQVLLPPGPRNLTAENDPSQDDDDNSPLV